MHQFVSHFCVIEFELEFEFNQVCCAWHMEYTYVMFLRVNSVIGLQQHMSHFLLM